MKPSCPYCGARLVGESALPFLPARQMTIYRAVAAAGARGIAPKDLLKCIYPGTVPRGGPVVMRVQIHALNKVIASLNQRVRGRGMYRLEAL